MCMCMLLYIKFDRNSDPRITFEPNAGLDRSWMWSSAFVDVATSELVETVLICYCIQWKVLDIILRIVSKRFWKKIGQKWKRKVLAREDFAF